MKLFALKVLGEVIPALREAQDQMRASGVSRVAVKDMTVTLQGVFNKDCTDRIDLAAEAIKVGPEELVKAIRTAIEKAAHKTSTNVSKTRTRKLELIHQLRKLGAKGSVGGYTFNGYIVVTTNGNPVKLDYIPLAGLEEAVKQAGSDRPVKLDEPITL